MKLYIFLSFICIISFTDSKSFDFSSFFPFNAYASEKNPSATATPTTSDGLLVNELTQENISLASGEYLEVNSSDASVHEGNESVSLEHVFSDSTENIQSSSTENSPDKDLNNVTSEEITQTQSSTKSKELLISMPSSSVASTSSSSNLSAVSISSLEDIFNSTEDAEEVISATNPPTFTVVTKTIYQKTVEWVGDPFILSILIPVSAGVLFAVSIIVTVAVFRCIRKRHRRRNFRKRVLPDSIKNLRPSDQARLLGDCDSSDEF